MVKEVLLGSDGVIESVSANSLIIDMGTTRVTDTREFATRVEAKGGHYVDAPALPQTAQTPANTTVFGPYGPKNVVFAGVCGKKAGVTC